MDLRDIVKENDQLSEKIREYRETLAFNRNDLRYLIGNEVAESRRSVSKILKFPISLLKIRKEYRAQRNNLKIEDASYNREDAVQALAQNKALKEECSKLKFYTELNKSDLKYLVGTEVLHIEKNPLKLLTLPFRLISIKRKNDSLMLNRKGGRTQLPPIEGIGETILFIATNGAGLGHLTRCLAIARKIKKNYPQKEIIFLTTSLALTVINREGFAAYCLPSQMTVKNVSTAQWNAMLKQMLMNLMDMYQFETIVFDGATPYASISAAMSEKDSLVKVWVKRGGEKSEEIAKARLELEKKFDYIVIPGERGIKKRKDDGQHRYVEPIIMLDKEDLWSRKEVRKYLKVPEDKKLIYIQLGAGNINDIDSDINRIIMELRKYDNVVMVLGESMIGQELKIIEDDIIIIKDYPNAKYFNGFDFAVSACGYNSFQEMVHFGVPTIFIPNMNTKTDDQYGRAMFVEKQEIGRVITDLSAAELANAVSQMMDSKENAKMRERAVKINSVNGADKAAEIICGLKK